MYNVFEKWKQLMEETVPHPSSEVLDAVEGSATWKEGKESVLGVCGVIHNA